MRRPRPDKAADLRADPAYAGLKARIVARTGHHYYADKDDLLADRLRRRLRATGAADCAAYAARLADEEAEWERLEAEITVGETFFFRYAEQFQALRETILPGLIAARADERTLRVWSAGCSTGAEPYSLAILIRELLGDALPDWRVSILGTDISVEALATARAAEYGRWALRTIPPAERLRHFTRLPPKPGLWREGGYALRPEFRGMVRFERGNLLRLAEPEGAGQGGVGRDGVALPYDLILCRNVLIYFDAETVAAVVRGLGRRLRPGGWMLLGHAEPNPAFSAFLDPVSLPGTVAYRPPEDGPPRARAVPEAVFDTPKAGPDGDARADDPPLAPGLSGADGVAAPSSAPAPAHPGDAPAEPPGADAAPVDPHPDGTDDPIDSPLARVRALADAGETAAAWRAVRAALDLSPTDAALRFYEGLLARDLGREAEAERGFRAALYLDRGFVMAHYHLGLLLLGLGRGGEAARALDNAVRLSQALPPGAGLPEGDGARAAEVAAGAAAARAGIGAAMVRGDA